MLRTNQPGAGTASPPNVAGMRKSLLPALVAAGTMLMAGCSDSANTVAASDSGPVPSGQGCVVDFYSASVMDDSGFMKMPSAGERCELFDGTLNPFVTGSFFQEFLNGRCIEFIVANPKTINIVGYC